MVPVDSRRVSRVPRYLGAALKEDCIFTYGAVTLYGRPFQTVRLTLSYPSFNRVKAGVTCLYLIIAVLQPRALLSNCTV